MTQATRETTCTVAEGFCPKRDDGTHCVHWWDGEEPCCACGDNSDEGDAGPAWERIGEATRGE